VRRLAFAFDVHQFGHAGLHPVGHLVLTDPGGDFRIADIGQFHPVEFLHRVDHRTTKVRRHAFGIGQKQHRVALAAELHTLVDRGQKAATPTTVAGTENLAGDQHDEAGQVVVRAADAIVDPRTDAGSAEQVEAGERLELRRRVVELVGVQRVDQAEFVGDTLQVGQQVGQAQSGLAAMREREVGGVGRAEEGGAFADEGELLALEHLLRTKFLVAAAQFGFLVEQIQMRGRADHVDVDHALGARFVVQSATLQPLGIRGLRVRGEQRREGCAAQSVTGSLKEKSPAEFGAHGFKVASNGVGSSRNPPRSVFVGIG